MSALAGTEQVWVLIREGTEWHALSGDTRGAEEVLQWGEIAEQLLSTGADYATAHEPARLIDVASFKTLAGVSRKYAIPLLEYFDREQVTRRAGDKRLILKPR
jgi:hypothetical protein